MQKEIKVPAAVPGIILNSDYPPICISKANTTSAVEYILHKANENVQHGYTDWMDNSVTGESVKLPQLEPFSRSVASALAKRGMIPGDVAIYLTSDVTRIYPIVIGVWRLGGIMYSSYIEDTQDYTLPLRIEESTARWIFCDTGSVSQIKEAVAQVKQPVQIFVFGKAEDTTSVEELFADDGQDCPIKIPTSGLEEPILILHTSGTTGRSKGVVHTNKSVLAFILTSMSMPRKLVMHLTKCTHTNGLLYPMVAACLGSSIVMMYPVTKENILKCVDTYKPSVAFGFPVFLLMLTCSPEAKKYDLSSLESIITGGIILPENFNSLMLTLPNVKYVSTGYGLTECGTICSAVDLSCGSIYKSFENLPKHSVGRLYPDTSLKVVDLETGLSLGPMKPGELYARSAVMAKGYWNRPEEGCLTFADGWLRTGDLGYYDEDGFIFIVDRVKETFKYYNNHISPSELEARIREHPAVAEAIVFGIRDPNDGDHIPKALVVLKMGETASSTEICEYAERKLADYKKFRGGIFIVDSLPRGNTGKISRLEATKIQV